MIYLQDVKVFKSMVHIANVVRLGKEISYKMTRVISYQRIFCPPPPRCQKCENSGKFRTNQSLEHPF